MVNKAILVGNLGKDPEVTFTTSGKAVCKFSLATSEQWKDKQSGEKQERTTWHNIVVWGPQAESCGQYLHKGSKIYLEGKISNRSYEKDGQTRYITEIEARDIKFLTPRSEGGGASTGGGGPAGEPYPDDDIPFASDAVGTTGLGYRLPGLAGRLVA